MGRRGFGLAVQLQHQSIVSEEPLRQHSRSSNFSTSPDRRIGVHKRFVMPTARQGHYACGRPAANRHVEEEKRNPETHAEQGSASKSWRQNGRQERNSQGTTGGNATWLPHLSQQRILRVCSHLLRRKEKETLCLRAGADVRACHRLEHLLACPQGCPKRQGDCARGRWAGSAMLFSR